MNFPIQRMLAAARWMTILVPMGFAVGSVSAFFLWSLDAVTRIRFSHGWLLFLLPLAGWLIGLSYRHFGKNADGGNNLLIDEIHQPGAGVPRRMAPFVLIATLATHLFGGSAGREGTAIQMGGGIAATFGKLLGLDEGGMRILLMAGVAAGFGSVFGTPVAGAIFALEVLIVGRIQYDALIPCFVASVVADFACRIWGIEHTSFAIHTSAMKGAIDGWLLGKVVLASVMFGLTAYLFSLFSHLLAASFKTHIPRAELRPVIGGVIIIGLFCLAGTNDYLGLGVLADEPGAITLPGMFSSTNVPDGAWAWKLLFTVVTVASGFKGGEVTPLFFIGAALGNTLAMAMGAPVDLLAGLGMVAIFAGATNTPIASMVLGVELFGTDSMLYIATACIISYACSGPRGIYTAQRIPWPKFPARRYDK